MIRLIKLCFPFSLIIPSALSSETITIKVFHVLESFGTETQELKNSIIINYNERGLMSDSTIYSHTIPLSEKYVYVTGPNEGLKLQHSYDKEKILSYQFEYDNQGKKISTTLYGTNDSLYWKEFKKYDDNGKIFKQIRYSPQKAINPEMIGNQNDSRAMAWAETYEYNKNIGFDHKELYDNYCLTITTYNFDSLGAPIKQAEYFDPSVIYQTIFFHNQLGQLTHQHSMGTLGKSLGSKKFEYDGLGRKTKTTLYSKDGTLKEILSTVFDDDKFITYDYYSDSLVELSSLKEVLLNNRGEKYVEAILDREETLLEKNVYYYDDNDRIIEIKKYDMIRRSRSENEKIPIRVHTYEYE